MAKRILLTLGVALLVISGLGFAKYRQIQTAMKGSHFEPPPEAITSVVAQKVKWPATTALVGTAVAIHGVTVSADLPGKIDKIAFESGSAVHQGDILVELDTRQERAQLADAEAQRELARINFARRKGLVDEGVISRSDYDQASAEQKSREAKVGELSATIERKTIRAPFTGVLGIRQANLGQYMAAGDPIVPLQSLDPIYVNFGVPQQTAGLVHVGQPLQITARDQAGAKFAGRVTALNSVVDETTRNIQVQATVANPHGKLRPGMFVEVEVTVGSDRDVIALPASAISYAPFGDSVWIIEDVKSPDGSGKTYRGVRQQFVKVEGSRGDQVGIVSGLKSGEEVVTSGVFKLRPGAAVTVNNSIQPANSPTPKPEDN
jgi:membrane fusion protein (multidrug efflux system)